MTKEKDIWLLNTSDYYIDAVQWHGNILSVGWTKQSGLRMGQPTEIHNRLPAPVPPEKK